MTSDDELTGPPMRRDTIPFAVQTISPVAEGGLPATRPTEGGSNPDDDDKDCDE